MEKIEVRCEIEYISNEILEISRKKKFDAILRWSFDESSEIELEILDIDYLTYKEKLYQLVKKEGQPKVFNIFPKDKFKESDIISIELFDIFKERYHRSSNASDNCFAFSFRKMIFRTPTIQDKVEAELYLTSSIQSFFSDVLFREWIDPDKNKLELLFNYKDRKIRYNELEIEINYVFFRSQKSSDDIYLKKEPYLKVSNNSNWTDESNTLCKVVTCLLSLYSERFTYSWVCNKWTKDYFEKTIDFTKMNFSKTYPYYEGIGIKEINPIDFLNDARLDRCTKFISELLLITEYRIRAHHSDGVNKFMFLFVIIEKVKDLFKREEGGKSDEDDYSFSFTIGNSHVNEKIKSMFEELKLLINEEQREEFLSKYDGMTKNIKRRAVKEQILELLNRLELDTQKHYDFDFQVAKRIRDKIFHGQVLTDSDNDNLNKIVMPKRMSRLASDLIYAFFMKTTFQKIGAQAIAKRGIQFKKE